MIASHPSWEPSSRPGSAREALMDEVRVPTEPDLAEHHSPSIAEAIAARMKHSPWPIVIASVSLGVLAGCLVKRR